MFTPICWNLVTNELVTNSDEACEKIGWYIKRWQIEMFFKTVKSDPPPGFSVVTRGLNKLHTPLALLLRAIANFTENVITLVPRHEQNELEDCITGFRETIVASDLGQVINLLQSSFLTSPSGPSYRLA